jgi:hypothetical protein
VYVRHNLLIAISINLPGVALKASLVGVQIYGFSSTAVVLAAIGFLLQVFPEIDLNSLYG